MSKNRDIIFLDPVLKNNIWGGTKLKDEFGYNATGNHIGECWGIAAHDNGDCKISGGIYAGCFLSMLYNDHPELFGNIDSERFPLLTKIIDAKDDLSIQVHPDDEYAFKYENGSYGKTECWYVIDCPKNASLVIGHNASDSVEMRDMIRQGRWTEFLRKVPIKKGSFLQIEPGTVHAITAGCLICETQQNSDITYRLYDYDRLSDGKPRELHLDKSMDVIKVPAKSTCKTVKDTTVMPENCLNLLEDCNYYKVLYVNVNGTLKFEQKYPYLGMTVIDGKGTINEHHIKKGDNFIIPNNAGDCTLSGKLIIIASTVSN